MSSTDASVGAEGGAVPSSAHDAAAPLWIIAGPTGAGKSALAMDVAERLGALIISADSRQVYRGFDIGTSKPTPAELTRVPHRGIDTADPTERYSAARWAREAAGWLDEASADGRPALVVGGTGLWLRALVRPLADEPPMDPEARAALQAELAQLGTPALRARVATLDPPRAHLGRTQLLRAAEVALLTGSRISDLHAAGRARPGRGARWVIVDPGDALPARLAARLDAMWRADGRTRCDADRCCPRRCPGVERLRLSGDSCSRGGALHRGGGPRGDPREHAAVRQAAAHLVP
jgi:tRNA dimethylallyltransferase